MFIFNFGNVNEAWLHTCAVSSSISVSSSLVSAIGSTWAAGCKISM